MMILLINLTNDDFIYYVIYYYSYAKQIIGKGLVSIKEKKWVTIDFNDPKHTSSLWKGSFDVVESYTFLSLEKKGDTAPVKSVLFIFPLELLNMGDPHFNWNL